MHKHRTKVLEKFITKKYMVGSSQFQNYKLTLPSANSNRGKAVTCETIVIIPS